MVRLLKHKYHKSQGVGGLIKGQILCSWLLKGFKAQGRVTGVKTEGVEVVSSTPFQGKAKSLDGSHQAASLTAIEGCRRQVEASCQ